MRLSKAFGIAALCLAITGCSIFGGDDNDQPDLPEQQMYEEALEALETGNYPLAVERLQLLEARYPFGRYSEQAQLELIYAYYQNHEPEAARSAADRFIRLHPNHHNIDYAYYLKGLTAFEQDRSFFTRYLPIDESSRDPGAALTSFESFSTLLERYPDSPYAPDAQKRMVHLKNRLAAYEIHVARYYIKRGAFVAAANRGRYVVENLPRTPAIPDALAVMIESYEALNMPQLAASARAVLSANYPDYQYQPIGEENKTLWDAATFNLLDDEPEAPAPSDGIFKREPQSRTEPAAQPEQERSLFSKATFGIFD
ncbi:outer membrane protein assembly factor BamD [Marinobacterium arenosum]|uniref:outer membrane protein assembly factor BamD n=1 Tax=Marinobacterium arenosum TaxID=2862496 RepID=UPI001C965C45|nr:outer membrane protein assembly factor BamD [Marinobacterium arenosum]MBY4675532.1 outer membrane protein assembly factor BamD [Marinobacterium arenosum]